MLRFALLGAGLGSLLTMWISGQLMARYSSRAIAHLSGILFPTSFMGPASTSSRRRDEKLSCADRYAGSV